MERIRKPFQGTWNIIRFNWHFYLLAMGFILLIQLLIWSVPSFPGLLGNITCILTTGSIFISLLVSFYVYDLSALFKMFWLCHLKCNYSGNLVNINAGFDETSYLLKHKFPDSSLIVLDFYNPLTHTEISIKRARDVYPPFPGTKSVVTSSLPLRDGHADNIFLILSAHEIRNNKERIIFFRELNRVLNEKGQIVVTEHLRDLANFLAYNIGFFHFIQKSHWYTTFEKAGFEVFKELKITPFVTTFILQKHGTSS